MSCSANDIMQSNISVDITEEKSDFLFKNLKVEHICVLSDSIQIGQISKVQYYDSKLYIWDKSTKSILCFSRDGEFLFKINSVGRGPSEYVGIDNFYISKESNTINIMDSGKKVLIYSADDGKYISTWEPGEKTIMFVDGISMQNSQVVLGILGPHYNISLHTNDSSFSKIPFNMNRDFSFMEKAFTYDEDCVLYVHGMDNNIYSINSDTTMIKYIVDYKGYEILNTVYEDNTPAEIQKIYESREVATRMDNLVNSHRFLSFSYWLMSPDKPVQTNYVLHTKHNGTTYNFSDNILFPIKDAYGDIFISVVDDIEQLYEVSSDNRLGKALKSLNKDLQIKEYSNPLIIYWKL